MERRTFSREFKLEAVKLAKECGVTITQAANDLGIAQSVLSRWVRQAAADKSQAFPGRGQMKPDDAEVARLKRDSRRPKQSATS
jgi:transposase-like protein